MNLKDVLIHSRSLIDTPEKWHKGSYAGSKEGKATYYQSESAVCFCSTGAVKKTIHDKIDHNFSHASSFKMQGNAEAILNRATLLLTENAYKSVVGFNDDPETTHADIMKVWDWAIQHA